MKEVEVEGERGRMREGFGRIVMFVFKLRSLAVHIWYLYNGTINIYKTITIKSAGS